MANDTKPDRRWFFSPPVGASLDNASLDNILDTVAQNDDYWSMEAPATEDDYCRENWAPLVYNEGEGGLTARATIYYVDRGLFTISLSGSQITNPAQAINPDTGLQLPSEFLDAYPVVNDTWNEFLDVWRQGSLSRYPLAVCVNREQLSDIIRHVYENKNLFPGYSWLTELDYFRRFGRTFYVPEE
jgi:hypothetical protein